jgi:hypothetical protein
MREVHSSKRMNPIVLIARLALSLQVAALTVAHAQIPYVTVWTPRSPAPPTGLVAPRPPPAASIPPVIQPLAVSPATARPRPGALAGAAFEKAAIEERVLAFQKQRAFEGSASAQYELGLRYLKGDGVVKDVATARIWIKRALDGGSSAARSKLAQLDAASE